MQADRYFANTLGVMQIDINGLCRLANTSVAMPVQNHSVFELRMTAIHCAMCTNVGASGIARQKIILRKPTLRHRLL